ncbi:MAG: GNAT family N-acetyltransferase [Deltaproteobacteria bacterium]|nr:GNAT family N-acetyltransferase [Deltaproteobacteria bacterium]
MKPADLQIRPASSSDLDQLVGLLRELFSIEADFEFNASRQRKGLTRLLADSRGCLLVAESAGRVVGMCSVQTLISTAEGNRVGLVEDVVVTAEHRGRGIGLALVAALEHWARDNGLTRLQLLADRTNAPALRFYEKLDWSPTQLICLRKKVGEAR